MQALFVGVFILLIMFGLRRIGISRTIVYVVLGLAFWVAILRSGVHATIAGVILGFMVPTTPRLSLRQFEEIGADMIHRFRAARAEGDMATANRLLGSFEQLVNATEADSERMTRKLNDWVSFLVLPLFALSNAGVTFSGGAVKELLASRIAWGVVLGLVIGKPIGIVGFCKLAVKTGPGASSQRRHLAADGRSRGLGGNRIYGLNLHQFTGIRRSCPSDGSQDGGARRIADRRTGRVLRAST